jgi:hypothetical protein
MLMGMLGPRFLDFVIKELSSVLTRGYQLPKIVSARAFRDGDGKLCPRLHAFVINEDTS